MNAYFTRMTQVSHENHGTIDKYIGIAIIGLGALLCSMHNTINMRSIPYYKYSSPCNNLSKGLAQKGGRH